ncbi:MAG: hypothetical protein RMX68_008895 [Aulosira sp. ZfuVER01]|nr:hypothetical protein [Aulosira sp. DedVER01a]MDZ8054843.1 hypothetical protein [Aulosira sp. ZfuCHP01]
MLTPLCLPLREAAARLRDGNLQDIGGSRSKLSVEPKGLRSLVEFFDLLTFV